MKGSYSSLLASKTYRRAICLLVALSAVLLTSQTIQADCTTPTGLSVSNLSTNAATLLWTQLDPGTQTDYDYAVSSNSITDADWSTLSATTEGIVAYGTAQTLNLTQLPLTGLQPGTTYYVLLRQNCEWDYANASEWVTTSFSTMCTPVALPIDTMKFASSTFPSCWMTGGGILPVLQSSYRYGSEGYAVKLQNSTEANSLLISPAIQGGTSASEIVFRVYSTSSAGKQRFVVGVADINSDVTTEMVPIYEDSTVAGQWIEFVASDNTNIFTNGYVYVIYAEAGNSSIFYVDNVIIRNATTCPRPSNLKVSNATSNSATFAWTENGTATAWVLELTPKGGTVLTVPATTNPFTYSSLEANTQYTVRVKANCGTEESEYCAVSASFKTQCGEVGVPYSNDFESSSNGDIPDCFTTHYSESSTAAVYTYSSNKFLRLNHYANTSPVYAVLPKFDTQLSLLRATFKYRYESTAYGRLEIGYMTDNSDVSTFVVLDTLAPTTTFTSKVVFFDAVPSTASYIAFRFSGVTSSYYYGGIDDLVVDLAPTCKSPTDLVMSSYGSDKATFTWKQSSSVSKWELKWTNGKDSGTEIITTTPSFTLSGLTEQTVYAPVIQVRAICQEGDTSEVLSSSFSFKTKCATIAIPYYNSFEESTSAIPSCWDNSQVKGTNKWSPSTSGYEGTNGLEYKIPYSYYYSYSGNYNLLMTPTLSLTENARFSFRYRNTISDQARLDILLYVDNGLTVVTDTLDSVLTASAWTKKEYDLSAYTGKQVVVGFSATVLSSDDYTSYVYLDDVEIEPLSTCPKPEKAWVGDITATTANVYVQGGNGTIMVKYGEGLTASATKSTTDTTIVPLTGLTKMTNYKVVAYAVCDATHKSRELDTLTFQTDQDPTAIPYATTDFSDWILKNGDQTNYWKVVDDSLCIVYKNTSSTEVKGYSNVISNVYATRSFTIEEEGMYTFSFKWRAKGESSYDYMLALVAPVSEAVEAGRDIKSSIPTTWTKLGSAERLNLQTALQTFEADLNMTPGTYRVMLYWRNDGSGNYPPAAIVSDFSIHQQMCAYPNKPTVAELSHNSVSLSWNSTGAESYTLKVFEGTSAPADIDTTTVAFEIVDTDQTTALFTGLQSQKDYVAVVRSNCGVSGESKWSDVASFKTLCAPKTLPYTEGFETSNTEFDCWTKVTADGGSYSIGTYTVHSGSKALYGKKTTFTTMELSFEEGKNLSNYLIAGYAKPYADSLKFTIGIQKSLSDATSYQLVTTVLLPSTNEWTEFSQSFAPLATLPDAADYKYIVINFDADQNIYLDDITIDEIPSCPKVASISVEDITISSASIDWQPNGTETKWEVCLKSGDNTVKTEVATEHPYLCTDLQSNTAYTVQIRAICGVGDTSEVRTASFKTLCSTVSLPFFEDFNSLSSGVPDCWDNTEGTTTTESHRWNYYTGYESTTPCVCFNAYSNTSGNTNFLKVVPIHIAAAARVSFSYKKQPSYSSSSRLDVYISTDGGGTYVDTLAKDIPATGSSFVDTIINLDSRFIGKDITLAFKGTSNYGSYNVYIDNVKVEAIPSCELSKTLEVKVSDVTTTTAKFTVSDSQQSDLQWEYVYGKQGFDIASATPITPASNEIVLEGLDPNTKYMIYVRHYCSGSDVSTWHSGTSFKTAAALPYAEDFNSLTTGIPDGWDNTEGTTTTESYRWNYYSTGYESTPCLRFNCYLNLSGKTNFLKSEPIYITEDARVSFVYKKQASSTLDVYISTDGGVAYADTLAESLPGTNSTFAEFSTNLDSRFTGQTITIVWKGISNYGRDDAYIYIDNVVVDAAPDCDTPKEVNLVERSSDAAKLVVVRRDGQAECTYEYALVEAGGNVDEATVVACPTSDTIVLSALQPQTDYELYVRTVCGEDSRSLWSNAKTFTTLCTQQSVPYSENFGTTTISQYDDVLLPSCWVVLNGADKITSSNSGSTSYVRIADENTLASSWSTNYYGVTGDYLLFNAYSTTSSGKILYAVMPEFAAKLDKLQVSFTTAFESASATDTLTLGYITNIADENSFVPLVNIPKSTSNVTHTIVLGTCDVPSIYASLALRYKCSSSYYRVGVDDLSVTVVNYPTGLKATDVTQTSATISWNAYEEAIGYQSLLVTGTDSTRNILTATTEALSGLDVSTTYKYQVRAIIAEGDTTAWSQVYTFTTKSAAIVFPYICGFEDDTENSQWRFVNGSTNKWYISSSSTDAVKSGTKALYISNDGGASNAYTKSPTAVSYAYRTVDLDAGDYIISFDGKAYGEKTSSGSTIYDYMAAFLVPYHESLTADTYSGSSSAAPTNWTPITIDGAMVLAGDANWHHGEAIISIPADTICNLVFMWRNDYSGGTDPAASVDNVRIEKILCMPLTSLSNTDVRSTSASFVWNKTAAESYQAVCLPSGVDIETALATYTLNNVTDTVLTVDTLRSLTSYDFYVRAVCEDDEKSAWKPISFTTTDVTADIPYSTGFESGEDQSWRFIQANETGHHNWYIGSAAIKDGLSGMYISGDGGVNNTTVVAADIVYAVRTFNFDEAGDYTIEFDYKCQGDYYEDSDSYYDEYYDYPTAYLSAYIVPGSEQISAGSSSSSSWIAMMTKKYNVTDWTHINKTLQISTPGVYAIAFQWVSTISTYYGSVTAGKTAAAVDNVKVEKVLCSSLREKPVITDIGSQSATISWTRESDGLQVRLGSSSDITSNTSTNILVDTVIMDTTAYLFENLEDNQKYYVAVRPVCVVDGEKVYSAYWDSLNFTTMCLALNMPYEENFDDDVFGTSTTVSCWNMYLGLFNADTINTSDLTTSSYYKWSYTSESGGLDGNHVRLNVWGTSVKTWMVTPSIVINSADANLIFDMALTTYNGVKTNTPVTAGRQADDRFLVAISADNGNTWMQSNTREWNNTGSVDVYDEIPSTGATVTIPLSAYNGDTIRIAFYAESTVSGGDNYMHIDNIKVFSGVVRDVHDTVCANTSYSGYGFVISKDNLTPGTTYYHSGFTEVDGVTTLYNLALYVRPEAKAEVSDTACANVPYEKYGFQIASPQSRDYILPTGRLYTEDGCDSIVVLHLYVPQIEYTHKLSICQNATPYRFGELDITESGTYTQTLQGVMCDSIVTLDVTVLPTETELRRTICEGESVMVGDQSFNTTGEYRVTLKNVLNCDSTVHLYLTVLGKERYTYTGYLCEGGSYTDKNFSSLTTAGKYTVTYTSVLGCDSIVELDLVLATPKTMTINESICDGEVYTFDGKDLATTGEYKGTFISSVGCDSIVTLKLQVLPTAEDSRELTLTVEQLPYTFAVTPDSTYIIDKLEEGTHWLEIRMANAAANGCDSVINLTLHIKQPESIDYVSDGVLQIVPNIIERDGTVFIRNTFGATSNETLTVELFDAVGRCVSQKALSGKDMAVDGFHTSGMYMVRVTDSNKRTYIGQVIVK